ncbi:hypothetical protein BCL79_0649 [Stenotrophomonas rhizophila]|uniref:Uncharacterized protein n=1 Tax=Stenotrophomonas rhizophila TaxID=216778 RepID=A0A498CQT3_9GAMM|nr:hypothetical protein [Stenotrophomonas rhizophila]RLK56265.1 hypothetical protein BCL79_0649 [Stenotrophomonas rhizophila]
MPADYQIARNDDAPEQNDEAYQFACDQVAAELESAAETADMVSALSGSRHVVHFLMSQKIPPHLLPYARDLAELVRNISDRVDGQMQTLTSSDMRDAA